MLLRELSLALLVLAASPAVAQPLLVVEQKVVLAGDPAVARSRARAALAWYLDTPNYLDNFRWLGFGDDDFADGGSDALVDALVAAGDVEAVVARCRAHLEAGATQVAIQPLEDDDPFGRETLRRLTPVLLERPNRDPVASG